MRKDRSKMEDELQPEYDLKSLKVRKLGKNRKSFGSTIVRLEPDVAQMFPSADAVNEALRLLIRVMRDSQASSSTAQNRTTLEQTDKSF
ncbi:hypothetical protein [Aliterella atlantica]|uniref:Uncharacterized protein n=1 Tax=Aliterella atlantica CENA595 TaxID=1618023 RepID=A0A0D8ZY87_9CYAN|nr:hypothetical protein UH38_00880 [Aliterella atlantica CENA595]